MMLCNIFDKKTTKTEYLTQVSLYAPETYKCKVYVNPNGTSKSKNDLQLVTLKSGESETVNAGYHTLEFANPIELKANSFAVVIEIQSSKYSATLPLESKIDSISAWDSVSVESGKCFLALGKDLTNSKCDVKKVQAYYYTNNSQKDYVLINTEISGISRDLTNDSVEYYYHLSANADEKNIENWVKITDTQDSNNKLQFVIDSRNVPNYKEIESEDVTYIYIKEVATKGENQSTVISNSMKLETNNNVETYVDDVKKGNLQSSNSNQENSNDVTIATGKLPKAGISIKIILTIIVIVSVVGIGIFIYLKYSKFRNV